MSIMISPFWVAFLKMLWEQSVQKSPNLGPKGFGCMQGFILDARKCLSPNPLNTRRTEKRDKRTGAHGVRLARLCVHTDAGACQRGRAMGQGPSTWRFMGSDKSGYSYPTYTPIYNYPMNLQVALRASRSFKSSEGWP